METHVSVYDDFSLQIFLIKNNSDFHVLLRIVIGQRLLNDVCTIVSRNKLSEELDAVKLNFSIFIKNVIETSEHELIVKFSLDVRKVRGS